MSKIAYDSVEKRIIATVLDDRSPFGFDNFNELKSEHFDLEITKKAFEWIKNQLDTDDCIY